MKDTKKQTEKKSAIQEVVAGIPSDLDNLTKDEAIEIIKQTANAIKNMDDMPLKGLPMSNSNNLVQELNNIDFSNMISGITQGLTDAQMNSNMATVEFLNNTAFETMEVGTTTQKVVRMVDFSYKKFVKGDSAANPPTSDGYKDIEIKVPFVMMLNIPTLRLQEANINFNAKLNSIETKEVKTDFKAGLDLGLNSKKINLKVTASYQRQSATGVKVEKEYTLGVNIKMVQDDQPLGFEKILGLLSAA